MSKQGNDSDDRLRQYAEADTLFNLPPSTIDPGEHIESHTGSETRKPVKGTLIVGLTYSPPPRLPKYRWHQWSHDHDSSNHAGYSNDEPNITDETSLNYSAEEEWHPCVETSEYVSERAGVDPGAPTAQEESLERPRRAHAGSPPQPKAMPDESACDPASSHGQRKRTRHEDDEAQARRSRRRRAEEDDTTSHSRRRRTREEEEDVQDRKPHRRRPRRSSRGKGAAGSAPDSPPASSGLDDDAIFREALFDALSDPAGAEYWEKLYGQPIHVYPRPTKVDPESGAMEPVSDQVYVAYVRRKMWEKTHEGYLESQKEVAEELRRKRREEDEKNEADERHRAEERRRAKERRRLQEEIDRTLRRAEERRKQRSERTAFADYVARWNDWDGEQEAIPWPTETGSPEGITEKSVRSFFLRGLDLKALGTRAFNAKLKEHRVRWHPDKMEQKMGGRTKVDETIMADITMTFQVIDTLFNDTRETR